MSDEVLKGLYLRRALAMQFISAIDSTTLAELSALGCTPEQKQEAMDEYKKQLAEIDRKITDITGKPPDIVIGLKTARLFGKSEL